MKHNELIDAVREEAKALGACELADKIINWPSLVSAMYSSQGMEFLCNHKGFPSIETCRELGKYMRKYGVTVDCKKSLHNKLQRGIFIGGTDAVVNCHGSSTLHTFAVMHGAKLVINARNYAVVRIYNIGGTIRINNDGTARILK